MKLSFRSLNPSFSGCPALGDTDFAWYSYFTKVLIPLLVDVPLWDGIKVPKNLDCVVLIPLLVDVPLWGRRRVFRGKKDGRVLIPLLVDVPLWGSVKRILTTISYAS